MEGCESFHFVLKLDDNKLNGIMRQEYVQCLVEVKSKFIVGKQMSF